MKNIGLNQDIRVERGRKASTWKAWTILLPHIHQHFNFALDFKPCFRDVGDFLKVYQKFPNSRLKNPEIHTQTHNVQLKGSAGCCLSIYRMIVRRKRPGYLVYLRLIPKTFCNSQRLLAVHVGILSR